MSPPFTARSLVSVSVSRWLVELEQQVGLDTVERDRRLAGLEAFCDRHDTDPDTLLSTWESYPELMVRRRRGAGAIPNLAVESFLVHNGVNVFGDVVCGPG